jgi:hypothetical protein
MSAAVSITAADLSDIEIAQAEIDAEEHARRVALAEALALLGICRQKHAQRRDAVDAAVDRLCVALDGTIHAREAYAEAGELLTEAMRLVVLRRGGVT